MNWLFVLAHNLWPLEKWLFSHCSKVLIQLKYIKKQKKNNTCSLKGWEEEGR